MAFYYDHSLMRLYKMTSRNSATAVHGVCSVLQLVSIEGNGARLQYNTRPVDK